MKLQNRAIGFIYHLPHRTPHWFFVANWAGLQSKEGICNSFRPKPIKFFKTIEPYLKDRLIRYKADVRERLRSTNARVFDLPIHAFAINFIMRKTRIVCHYLYYIINLFITALLAMLLSNSLNSFKNCDFADCFLFLHFSIPHFFMPYFFIPFHILCIYNFCCSHTLFYKLWERWERVDGILDRCAGPHVITNMRDRYKRTWM